MKNLIITAFLLFLAPVGKVMGQTTAGKQNHYVVTTTKINQLEPILMAAEELKVEDGTRFGQFKILVCGKAVESLARRQTMGPYLKRAQEVGAQIIACQYSMRQLNMEKDFLTEGVQSVDNAILENLQLQREGYISLGL